ncbi:hypothetical protein ACODT5_23225 [Streptomyces sp. 5.8]|uniref:hypothetical protein n=1 Tax=Streptomyces sp. 5.8 TaxID=3406571 RepID=UPI003BB77399
MTSGTSSRCMGMVSNTSYDDDVPMDRPGERLPLLTRGEAEALVALLGDLAEVTGEDLQMDALELQSRLGMRLPAL